MPDSFVRIKSAVNFLITLSAAVVLTMAPANGANAADITYSKSGVLVAPGYGKHGYALNPIDTTAYASGTITININVGASGSAASFDLYAAGASIPTADVPQSLAHAWDLAPGANVTISYSFTNGQIFQLGAEGNWGSTAGSTNSYSYVATISGTLLPAQNRDAYNISNSQLTIPQVAVGSITYKNVVISVGKIVSIGTAPAVGTTDSYDGTYLTIPVVSAYGTTYYNVVITVGQVLSVDGNPVGGAPVTLSVTKTGSGSGIIASSPAGISCGTACSASFTAGTNVALTAAPASGSHFNYWSGACSGTGACVVPMNANAAVNATFVSNSSPTAALSIYPGQVVYGTIDRNQGKSSHLDPLVLVATGGNILSNYTWSITTGYGVPQPSIVLSPLTGVVQAKSTSLQSGTYTMHVSVTDGSTTYNGAVTIDLNDTCDSSSNSPCSSAGLNTFHIDYLPHAKVGNAYSASLEAGGGTPPYSWALASGVLPLGMHIDSASGALLGSPTVAGSYDFYANVTDSAGHSTASIENGVTAARYTLVVDP